VSEKLCALKPLKVIMQPAKFDLGILNIFLSSASSFELEIRHYKESTKKKFTFEA